MVSLGHNQLELWTNSCLHESYIWMSFTMKLPPKEPSIIMIKGTDYLKLHVFLFTDHSGDGCLAKLPIIHSENAHLLEARCVLFLFMFFCFYYFMFKISMKILKFTQTAQHHHNLPILLSIRQNHPCFSSRNNTFNCTQFLFSIEDSHLGYPCVLTK